MSSDRSAYENLGYVTADTGYPDVESFPLEDHFPPNFTLYDNAETLDEGAVFYTSAGAPYNVTEAVAYQPPEISLNGPYDLVKADQQLNFSRSLDTFTGSQFRGIQDNVYNSYAGVDIVAEIVLPGEGPVVLGELQTISTSTHRENTPVRFLGHVNVSGFVKGPRTIAGSLIFTVFNYYAFYRLKSFQRAIANNLYPLADMLPPFDVVLTFANESGSMSKQKIYGVTIVDEGQTMSVDDLITEQTYAYMARGIQPLTAYYIEEAHI